MNRKRKRERSRKRGGEEEGKDLGFHLRGKGVKGPYEGKDEQNIDDISTWYLFQSDSFFNDGVPFPSALVERGAPWGCSDLEPVLVIRVLLVRDQIFVFPEQIN